MIRLVAALAILLTPIEARAQDGRFVGGGVGSVSCPQFLNLMATARQAGGLRTPAGVTIVGGFEQYVLGFETGYNLRSGGNILGPLGDQEGEMALYAIEPYCAAHPGSAFADGVMDLALRLRRN